MPNATACSKASHIGPCLVLGGSLCAYSPSVCKPMKLLLSFCLSRPTQAKTAEKRPALSVPPLFFFPFLRPPEMVEARV